MNTTIRKEFVDTFNKLTHKLSPWEVWKDFVGEILLVGINYDKDSKKHQCYIERQYS